MKKDHILLSLAALFSFLMQAVAWPLAAGRDGFSYLYYAYDFFSAVPEDRFTMLFRTPLAPLMDWILVSVLSPGMAELAMGLIYIFTINLAFRIGCFVSRKTGWLFAGLLLCHFGWGSLFHVISNDPPIAILVPLVLATALFCARAGNPFRFALVGLIAAALSLARPGIFPALVLLPFFFTQWKWRTRALGAVAFAVPCFALLGGWGAWNLKKHGVFSMAPGADVVLPLGRVLGREQILREDNGPSSRLLADAIRSELIPLESRPLTPDEYFLAHPSYFDYMELARKRWGNYSVLKAAAWEAVYANPGKYFSGVAETLLLTFAGNLKLPVPLTSGARVYTHKKHVAYTLDRKDQWVPIANFDFSAPLGDDGIAAGMRAKGPHSARAWEEIRAYPHRDGSVTMGTQLNLLCYVFPPMLLWLFAALPWFWRARRFSQAETALLFVLCLCLATNVLACFSIWSVVYEYRLPFDPVFILAGLLGLRVFPYFRKITED